MIERGVIDKINAARKEFALKGGHLKRTATFVDDDRSVPDALGAVIKSEGLEA